MSYCSVSAQSIIYSIQEGNSLSAPQENQNNPHRFSVGASIGGGLSHGSQLSDTGNVPAVFESSQSTVIPQACIARSTCDEWSMCDDTLQIRVCKDTCSGTQRIESRACIQDAKSRVKKANREMPLENIMEFVFMGSMATVLMLGVLFFALWTRKS